MTALSPIEFEPILDSSFWSLPSEWSSTDPSLVYTSVRSMECYDEHLSDKCMTLLLGTWYEYCIITYQIKIQANTAAICVVLLPGKSMERRVS